MRTQVGRDDRPARPQVRVDLEGCVRPGDTGRHEGIAGVDKVRHVARWTLAREDERGARAFGSCGQLADLCRVAADDQHGQVGHQRLQAHARLQQQVEALVLLERARVQHDRLRRGQPPGGPHRVAAWARRGVDVTAHDVLDEHGAVAHAHLMNGVLQLLADGDHHLRPAHHVAFGLLEPPAQRFRAREPEVPELLRQARVHVVEMRDAEPAAEPHAEDAHLLVRVDGVIPASAKQRHAEDRQGQKRVQQHLDGRRPDRHLADQRRPPGTDDAQVRQVDVAADRVGHQVDMVAILDEGLDTVEFAERRATRLEERLGREHQDPERCGGGVTMAGRPAETRQPTRWRAARPQSSQV